LFLVVVVVGLWDCWFIKFFPKNQTSFGTLVGDSFDIPFACGGGGGGGLWWWYHLIYSSQQ
jgi:hypothetical protein